MKMVNETVKIMGDESIKVTATTVRVPVITGHSEAINIETEKELGAEKAREILASAPGIKVIDNIENLITLCRVTVLVWTLYLLADT